MPASKEAVRRQNLAVGHVGLENRISGTEPFFLLAGRKKKFATHGNYRTGVQVAIEDAFAGNTDIAHTGLPLRIPRVIRVFLFSPLQRDNQFHLVSAPDSLLINNLPGKAVQTGRVQCVGDNQYIFREGLGGNQGAGEIQLPRRDQLLSLQNVRI